MNDPNSLRPGMVVDSRFSLRRCLGAGSSGVVWLCWDIDSNGPIALKLLHPHLRTSRAPVDQLAREANVMRDLQHPHIVRAIAFSSEGQHVYLAMEYLEGEVLHEVLGQHTRGNHHIPHSMLATLMQQICEAVSYAHQRGIIHRDLKPQNVIVDRSGAHPSAKVLDFGIARLIEGSSFDTTTFGRRLGSLFYMSPEQIRGEPADARSDIFALGCILYELLTLRRAWAWDDRGQPLPAFTGPIPSGEANSMAEVFSRINRAARPRPSSVRSGIPQEFDELVARATARSAVDRYATVESFLEDADEALRLLGGRPAAGNYLLDEPEVEGSFPTEIIRDDRETRLFEVAPRSAIPRVSWTDEHGVSERPPESPESPKSPKSPSGRSAKAPKIPPTKEYVPKTGAPSFDDSLVFDDETEVPRAAESSAPEISSTVRAPSADAEIRVRPASRPSQGVIRVHGARTIKLSDAAPTVSEFAHPPDGTAEHSAPDPALVSRAPAWVRAFDSTHAGGQNAAWTRTSPGGTNGLEPWARWLFLTGVLLLGVVAGLLFVRLLVSIPATKGAEPGHPPTGRLVGD